MDLIRLNHAFLTLIPRKEAASMHQFESFSFLSKNTTMLLGLLLPKAGLLFLERFCKLDFDIVFDKSMVLDKRGFLSPRIS